MSKQINEIIKQAIDIHVHIGPEAIPRKYSIERLIREEKGKIGGFVLKNHFFPTVPLIAKQNSLAIFGGLVLNNFVGGLNTEAIYAMSTIAQHPFIVWFPTIHADNFLRQSMYEIAPEWVKNKNIIARKATAVVPVIITKNNKLTPEAIKVLYTIKQCNAVLATGHISWEESLLLVDKALAVGIKNIVITHPIYQRVGMPIRVQKSLAQRGCFIEQCYSMYSIDKITIEALVEQIQDIGYKSIILSSDVGQTFSPAPSDALYKFAKILHEKGIKEDTLHQMLVKNPKKLMSIT